MQTSRPVSFGALMLAATLVTTPVRGADPVTSEQQIADVGRKWVDAENAHDEATVSALLDDSFVATFDDRQPLDKDIFLRFVTHAGLDTTRRQVVTDRSTHVVGDTGVELGTDTISGTEAGKPYALTGRFTAVYARRDGVWKAVALHFGSMKPAQ